MNIPDWFNKHYIEEALRVYYKDTTLKVIDCDIKTALAKGENYGGIMSRINVIYTLKNGTETLNKQLIGKTSFESDAFAKEKMQPYDIFNREMSIYEHVLPALQTLLLQINDHEQLFAKALHVDYQRQALIFEDLGAAGFVMADRIKGLDRAHIELILRKIAKMHATSAVLNERNNGSLESYDRGFFNCHTNSYSSFFLGNLLACSRMLAKYTDYKNYSKKLEQLKHNYMDIGINCFMPIAGQVNVLCHGDLWTNNVMFKYDKLTDKPLDVIIIDFQYSAWGAPALDLHYFFNTSLQEEIRLEKLDMFYKFYYTIFSDILRKLNYYSNPVPSLHQFYIHMEKKRFMAFHSSCIIQPVMINEDATDADFNALMSEDERGMRFKNNIYKNVKVQQNVKNLLPIFDKRGLLDIDQCN